MRPAWLATLMLFWVAAVAVQAQVPAPVDPSSPKRSAPSRTKEPKAPRHPVPMDRPKEADAAESFMEVHGDWCKTASDAERDVLEKAQIRVLEYLQIKEPAALRKPDLEYIRKNLLKDSRTEFRQIEDANVGIDLGQMQRLIARIEVSRRDRETMLREDRKYRQELRERERSQVAEYRMLGLGKVLGVVVALLGGVGGYIRLDELTKGYYTAWLRLAAASLVGVVSAGLWLLV
jgi:hypothetical protein